MSSALLPDPLGVSRINHQFSSTDRSWETGHALHITGVPTQDTLDGLCAAISSVFVAELLHVFSPACVYKNGQLLYSDGAGLLEGTSTINLPGTNSGTMAMLSAAVCCSLRTGDHYRGGHGRMYFSGIPQATQDSDRTWDAGFIGAFETAFAAYLEGVAALTFEELTVSSVGVVHRFSDGTELSPHTYSPLTGSKTQRRICSQRRRLGRLI